MLGKTNRYTNMGFHSCWFFSDISHSLLCVSDFLWRKLVMSWNYYEHGVTQSFIRLFRQCKYQTYLRYVKGVRAKRVSPAMTYGSICHYVMENVLKQQLLHNDYSSPSVSEIGKYVLEYANASRIETNNDEFTLIYHTICGSLKAYFEIHSIDKNKYNIIAIEQPFSLPYLDTFITGKIDLVLEDANGDIWITDHKVLWSRADMVEILETLPYDIQCNLYVFAGREIWGDRVKGVIYDVMKKTDLRQKVKETALEFGNRTYEEMSTFYIKYLIRLNSTFLEDEVLNWEKYTFRPFVLDIKQWFDNGFLPRPINDDALISKYGKSEYYEYIVNQNFLFYTEDETQRPFGEI